MGMGLNEIRFRYFANLSYCSHLNYVRQQWYSYNWLRKKIKWAYKDVEYEDIFNKSVDINNTIFVYWKQGWNNIPAIVRKCSDSIRRNCGNHPVVFLDESNIEDYVRFPQIIVDYHQKGIIKEAHFSDILRIFLLFKYGGVWCDATCMLTSPIPNYIWDSPIFMFQKTILPEWASPIKGSNWFIRSNHNNVLLKRIINFLLNYYSHKKNLINYYVFHLVLAVLVDNDKECASAWDGMPYICNMNPHILQFSFDKNFNKERFENIVKQCFIHKLTYKYKEDLLNDRSNILSYLLKADME